MKHKRVIHMRWIGKHQIIMLGVAFQKLAHGSVRSGVIFMNFLEVGWEKPAKFAVERRQRKDIRRHIDQKKGYGYGRHFFMEGPEQDANHASEKWQHWNEISHVSDSRSAGRLWRE